MRLCVFQARFRVHFCATGSQVHEREVVSMSIFDQLMSGELTAEEVTSNP